jgi:1-acyl-sn-glycerol-3-phosphate acyltransferase
VLRLGVLVALTSVCALAVLAVPRARARLFRAWSRAVLRLLRVRVAVEGVPPRGAFALVANHLSYFDVIVLGALVDSVFVAKADVAGWPIVGWLCERVHTIFIDRTRKRDLLRVLPILERKLAAGESVAFFPEGTSSGGESVLRFRSPLFEAPIRAARPVVCAALRYETNARDPHASESVCYWGDMVFAPHVFGLLGLRGFTATIEFSPETLWEDDRKRLAACAHEAIAKRLEKTLERPRR